MIIEPITNKTTSERILSLFSDRNLFKLLPSSVSTAEAETKAKTAPKKTRSASAYRETKTMVSTSVASPARSSKMSIETAPTKMERVLLLFALRISLSSSLLASAVLKYCQIAKPIITSPPARWIQNTGTILIRKTPMVTMIALVIVNAVAPEAKAIQGLTLVESAKRRKASLSVSSAMKIVAATVKKGVTRAPKSAVKLFDLYSVKKGRNITLDAFKVNL
jgi:hypothetical protein